MIRFYWNRILNNDFVCRDLIEEHGDSKFIIFPGGGINADNLGESPLFLSGMRIRFWPKTGSWALHFKLREIFNGLLNEYFR